MDQSRVIRDFFQILHMGLLEISQEDIHNTQEDIHNTQVDIHPHLGLTLLKDTLRKDIKGTLLRVIPHKDTHLQDMLQLDTRRLVIHLSLLQRNMVWLIT